MTNSKDSTTTSNGARFAIIETGGKQYQVTEGQKLMIEKLPEGKGSAITFANVLLVADGEKVEVGVPYVKGAGVAARVVEEGRGDRKIVFRYHSKTRYRKFKTHRQRFTKVEITKI
ncbi:MAG: 50S ribosomal protein L21 [Candidatus Jorgensenbacteria bacterium]|nr:50S ribosomal protein L21 [Candidatus Jorgensenbacteria bacterium]